MKAKNLIRQTSSRLLAALILLTSLATFTACKDDDANFEQFVGKWSGQFIDNELPTINWCSLNISSNGDYTLVYGMIGGGGSSETRTGKISLNGNYLILTGDLEDKLKIEDSNINSWLAMGDRYTLSYMSRPTGGNDSETTE